MTKTPVTWGLWLAAFLIAPLIMVALRGGANLESRVQQINTLRVSIQSMDPAREAIDNPELDTALIAEYLAPSRDREAKAKAYYAAWRLNKDKPIVEMKMKAIEYEGDKTSAVVHQEFETKVGEENYRYAQVSRWEKLNGVWRLNEVEEKLIETTPVVKRGVLEP